MEATTTAKTEAAATVEAGTRTRLVKSVSTWPEEATETAARNCESTGAATIVLVGGNQMLVDFMKHAVLRGCKGAEVELSLDEGFSVRVVHAKDLHALTIYVGGTGRPVSVPTAKALITVLQAFVDSQSAGGVL